MTDQRSSYYCDTRAITQLWRPGQYVDAITLAGNTGSGQTHKDQVYLSAVNTLPFVPGDWVMVYDSDTPWGEEAQVQQVVSSGATPYLELTAVMTNNYTTAKSAKVKLMSAFMSQRCSNGSGSFTVGGTAITGTRPSSEEVYRIIQGIESYIDQQTRNSWRSKTISEESQDFPRERFTAQDWLDGVAIKLNYRNLKYVLASDGTPILSTADGDKLLVWEGNTWADYLITKNGGHSGQHWIDVQKGIVFVKIFYKIYRRLAVRVTYRIGESTIPEDIKRCASLLATAQLLETDDSTVSIPAGDNLNIITIDKRADHYRKEAETILDRYRESVIVV